jgi:hypothetical protein
VRFDAGEPFCHFFPVQRRVLVETEPRWQPLSQTPELERDYQAWMRSRGQFLHDLEQDDPEAKREGWQRSYFRGPAPGQCPAGVEHRVKLRLAPFTRAQPEDPQPGQPAPE